MTCGSFFSPSANTRLNGSVIHVKHSLITESKMSTKPVLTNFLLDINQSILGGICASTFAFHPFLRPEWAVFVGCHFVTTCQSVVGGIWLSRFALKGLSANVYWTAWLFLLMLLFRSLALHKQSPSVNFVPFFSPYCSWYFV